MKELMLIIIAALMICAYLTGFGCGYIYVVDSDRRRALKNNKEYKIGGKRK